LFREASAETLMRSHEAVAKAQTDFTADSEQPYRPLLDGVEFHLQPFEYFSRKRVDKEIIIGTTSDEMAFFKLPLGNRITKEHFLVSKKAHFSKFSKAFKDLEVEWSRNRIRVVRSELGTTDYRLPHATFGKC